MHIRRGTDLDDGSRDVTNLFDVYGAVDHHLEQKKPREKTHRVALLLPIYRERDVHWFQDFATATDLGKHWEIGDPLYRVTQALEDFAETEPRSRMRARRLYAVAVAARAFPDLPPRTLAAAALGTRQLEKTGGDPDARAEHLVDLLRRDPETDDPAGRDAWWDRLVKSPLIPEGVGPRPCSGSLAWVDVGGDRDLAPTLKTVFDARLAFDAARTFCEDPTTWECFPSWCEMKPNGEEDGFRRYQEKVSFECHNPKFPEITVNLNFDSTVSEDGPHRVALAEYWLSKEQPYDNVVVNQGWLEVVELSRPPRPIVRITTTKTVKFRDDMGGPGLVAIANRVGYVSMVEDLVCCASKAKGEKGYPDVPVRGEYVPEDTEESQASARPRRGPVLNYGALINMMVKEGAAAAETSIDEFTKAAGASYGKLGAGYKAEDLVQDTADYWTTMLRQGARLTDLNLRVGRTTPRARRRTAARTRGQR